MKLRRAQFPAFAPATCRFPASQRPRVSASSGSPFPSRERGWGVGFAAALLIVLSLNIFAATKPAPQTPDALQKALAGPLKSVEDIVFVTRLPYNDGHWYANIGYYCEDEKQKAYTGNGRPDCGKLFKLNIRSGNVTTLLDAQGGSLRDPQVHYDGKKILFAYRKAGADNYNLYEIGIDGSGLRQVTTGPYDDYEPTYLPDGDILFVSTRCRRWVSCWKTNVGIMHRSHADGSDIHPVSCNIEHDNTPWVMHDGRILYMRWEYVDRSQMDFHHLWAMFPDGTGQTVFYGNQSPGTVMLDAKPIPGSDKIVASFSPGHGANEHGGRLTILSPDKGPDDPAAARILPQKGLIRDPFPLSEDCFIVARENKICVIDGGGNSEVLYTHPGPGSPQEPRPILAHPREPVLAPRSESISSASNAALGNQEPRAKSQEPGTAPDSRLQTSRLQTRTGKMLLADVYNARNLPGIQRGDVKKLLVIEVLPKPVNFSGGMDLTSCNGSFNLERVLGTVPVEDDGSAYFEVPAGRPIFFVALDKNDLSLKRMQSFTTVMPGETLGCTGCHEQRTTTAYLSAHAGAPAGQELRAKSQEPTTPLAMRRPPAKLQPFDGLPTVPDFLRDVQPILDQHCVSCHSPQKREGRLLLTGDIGPSFCHSYLNLLFAQQIADGRNGLGNQPPRTIGSAASPLLKLLDGSHYGAKVPERQQRMLWLWVEAGAVYAGTYAGLRNAQAEFVGHDSPGKCVFGPNNDVLKRRCSQCHSGANGRPLPLHVERKDRAKDFARPTAVYERLVIKNDPQRFYSSMTMLNLSRPELSSLLLAPLAKSAGGWGCCVAGADATAAKSQEPRAKSQEPGAVFKDTKDPDYVRLLESIRNCKAAIEAEHQFGTSAFKPNPQYIREMKRFGILAPTFDLSKDPIDVYATDQKYWELFQ
ncbi:MAG TPA: hypothetical protein VGP72_20185 [Planctomycetota bacterium]|jgi:hypothetical protein